MQRGIVVSGCFDAGAVAAPALPILCSMVGRLEAADQRIDRQLMSARQRETHNALSNRIRAWLGPAGSSPGPLSSDREMAAFGDAHANCRVMPIALILLIGVVGAEEPGAVGVEIRRSHQR